MLETIISVHTPKVAGTSFRLQLERLYGQKPILRDYDDDPVNPVSPISMDPHRYDEEPIRSIFPKKVVHGHFHPRKYLLIENAFRMTFLRHPIENVISIYYFWRAHERSTWDSPIFHYTKDNGLSLLRFAMLPKIRYLYTRSYFGEFDMRQFDFIGDYAKYDQELFRLGMCLGIQFSADIQV